jgi:MSHA biogenesis protein MshJ
MSSAKAQWQKLAARFDAKSLRERRLLAAAALGGVLLLGHSLLVDPAFVRARLAERQAEQQQAEASSVSAQVAALEAQLRADPDAGRKAEAERLAGKLKEADANLKSLEAGFVPPGQMNDLLEKLLASHVRLRLVSLKSLPPTNLAADATKKDAAGETASAGFGLYKHGVELSLEGGYADLYAWLAQVEASGHKLLWGDVRFAVSEYPRATLTLTLYTLSTDKAWLAI